MGFDCITEKSFEQWFMLSLSGTATAEIRTSKTGYSYSVGAKTETFGKWSVSFVDVGSTDEPEENEDIKLEVASSEADKPFVLTFKKNGTLETGWTNYPTTIKSASWSVVDGALSLDMGETGYTVKVNGNEIAINYGQMGEKVYTLTDAQLTLLGVSLDITLEVETSDKDNPFVLTFKADGTLETGWTKYPTTIKCAKWYAFGNKIVLELDGTNYSATVNGKEIKVNYGQMGEKTFTLTDAQLARLLKNTADITSEVESSDKDNPFVLTFKAGGALETGWMKYAQTIKSASWSVVDGALSLDMGETGYTVKVNGNEIAVNYGQMGEKTFTLTDAQLAALLG